MVTAALGTMGSNRTLAALARAFQKGAFVELYEIHICGHCAPCYLMMKKALAAASIDSTKISLQSRIQTAATDTLRLWCLSNS